jgi:outer membrane protein TolC
MRKHFVVYGAAAGTLFIVSAGFGKQEPGATAVAPNAVTPAPSPPPALIISTPTPPPALLTPTPISPIPSITPPPVDLPSPTPSSATGTMTTERSFLTTSNTFQWSEKGAPVFNLDQAVLTALRQNPDILRAKEEIERTRGVILEIGAQALPHVNPRATLTWTDPNLGRTSAATTFSTSPGVTPGPTVAAAAATATPAPNLTDTAYSIQITGTQLVFNYSTFRSIRATFFQRDSAYFAFRNVVDQVIATVKTQFYQVILNRALIRVQEESVQLLESQLKDQQNRFEAGTVPRFNVLQAQVQLSNQIPNLIAARNNYRISILQLAKTLGLDFNPARGNAAPLRVVGDLVYVPRKVSILEAIELGKQSRAFLKQARANVFNAIEQVHVALGGFLPNFTSTGGYEIFSSPFSTSWDDVSKGWVFGVTGNWALWDSGETYGRVKQQRALLSEAKITYDDDVRQVELEIQQAASNLLQNRELIQATEKNVEQADEAVRLAKARLDAGAGTQLDVLNAQVQLTTAQSTRLQALFGYDSSLAEFDRVTGAQSTYTETFSSIAPRATRSRRYYTGSDVDATGKPKAMTGLESVPVTPMSSEPSSK